MAKVSLMMPVYKTEPYIEKSLRSALDQTFDDLEIVIVNDATPDGSMDVVRRVLAEYPHREVKVIDHPTNMGLAVARQTAIDNATGEYTIHLDSDDWVEPDMVERLYECAIKDDADIVVCDLYYEYLDCQTYCSQPASPTGKELAKQLIRGVLHGYVWNKLIRRAVYVDNDIKWIPGINMFEDLLIMVKLSGCAAKVSYLPAAFLHYNKMNSDALTSIITRKNHDDIFRVIAELEHFTKEHPDYADCTEDIIGRKLYIRLHILEHAKGKVDRSDLDYLFKDSPRRYVFSYLNRRIDWKMALYFASIGWLWATNLIFRAQRIYRNIKHKH